MSPGDSLDVVEDVIRSAESPVVTAPEVAEAVVETGSVYDDVADPRREAYADLELLERAGAVDSKQTGAHARAWWHTDRVRPAPDDHTDAEPVATDAPTPSIETPDEPAELEDLDATDMSTDARNSNGTGASDLEAALDGWRPGRSRAERLERVDVGVQLLEWLREQERAVRREDVLAETYDGLAIEGQSEDAYWRRTARPALKHAADEKLVSIDGRDYRWID